MRQKWLFLVLYVILFLPATVYAQGPTPPPDLLEICLSEGKFHPLECARAVGDTKDFLGILALFLIAIFVFYFLTPSGKGLQDKVKEKSGEWWLTIFPLLRPAVHLSEIQRREAKDEYLSRFEKSETLRQPDEIASRFDEYLNTLHAHENPLFPSEDKKFVGLESGLSIPTRIGLAVKVESQQSKSIAELKTFNSLEEAMNYADERTGHPYPALALLGEPGAGKSTLLRNFARQIVKECIIDSSKPVPIFVSLSAYKGESPLMFLRQHWINMLGFDGLEDALANEKVWLFLDGLNEMPRTNYDLRVIAWRDFLRKYCLAGNGNRALIACRRADYGDGVDAPTLTIHAMDDERIQQFLKKRVPDHAEALWGALKEDRDEGRGAIYELAKTPFWLDMLSRYSGKDGLPRNRADLITRFINEWLDRENLRPQGRETNFSQREAFIEGMTQLAWTGLARSQNYTFRKAEARKLLEAHQTSLHVNDILGLARDCSLISEESNTLRFQHQLLQEYFAAHELKMQFSAGKNLTKLWKTPWRRWKFVQSEWTPLPSPPQTFWEEAVILAVGMLDAEQAERLALAVLSHNPPLAARCILESDVLAIDGIVSEKAKQRLQADLQNPRVRLPARLAAGRMLAKLGDPRLLKQHGEIELTGGRKTTFIAPVWVDVPAGSFQMGTTPAQSWLLKRQRADVYSNEQPAHSVQISAFKMARFPVTVAEYRCFMDADGYENDTYWKEENSLRWRNAPLPYEESYQYQYLRSLREDKEGTLKQVDNYVRQGSWSPAQAEAFRNSLNSDDESQRKQWEDNEKDKRDSSGKVTRPWLWDYQKYTVDNQPVIGVTWYEACAYAAWLTDVLQRQGIILEQEEVRLPTEAEWEKAARGTLRRLWAWGYFWNSSFANSLEGRVMQPSTVGAYPQNKSPYGVQDMIGNVWEWCADWYNENEYRERLGKEVKDPGGAKGGNARVLRGGAWFNYRGLARWSARYRYAPDSFYSHIGFRLVLLPIIQISAI